MQISDKDSSKQRYRNSVIVGTLSSIHIQLQICCTVYSQQESWFQLTDFVASVDVHEHEYFYRVTEGMLVRGRVTLLVEPSMVQAKDTH